MKQWMYKKCNADTAAIAKRYNISGVFARVLVNRGLYTWKDMDAYLFPDMEKMYKPGLMKDVTKAAEILMDAIKNNVKIRVIGDYDVDGVMSSYILYRGIVMLGGEVSCRIPHRVKDGYGIRDYMVDEAKEDGIGLIITCDNGISAVSAASRAKELGITYILTDHHEVPDNNGTEIIPDADAVVNPKQKACEYPYNMICGAGVVYKLMSYIFEKKNDKSYINELLPFAAIATVCDVVPLADENRIIVSNGLKILNDTPHLKNLGMRKMLEILELSEHVRSGDLGFRIGPCINAAGRLDDAALGLKMLTTTDEREVVKLVNELITLNEERKELTAQATNNAIAQIEEMKALEKPVLVIYLKDCHESVAGIVAGRIREKYYRPAYVLTDGEKGLKGSGRSIPGYHMQQALQNCQELLTEFGGHALAAGFSLPKENLDKFRDTLNEQCNLTDEELVEKISFDMELELLEATKNLVEQLHYMEPFGESNDSAIFARGKLKIKSMYLCGKENQIAKLKLEDEGLLYEAVDFHADNCLSRVIEEKYGKDEWEQMKQGKYGQQISILYQPEINNWSGNVQMKIIDCM